MAGLQPYSQRDFSKGVFSDVSSFIAPKNSVRHAINFVFDEEYGAAKVRKGSTIVGSQLVGENNSILGLFNFRDRDSSNHALIAAVNIIADGSANIYNVATGSALATGLTAGATYRFEEFLDTVVFQNGTDTPLGFNGTGTFTASTALATASMPIGIDIINYKDRLWVLQASGTLLGSSIPSSPSFNSISWSSGNKTIPIDPDSTSYTGAGIGLARVSGLLLIFKERALYSFNGSATQADFLYDVGCSSVRSISTGAGSVFFFNADGIWVTRGSEPVRISRPVQAYINGMSSSNYSSVSGFANGQYYWCSIGDVTIGSNTYTNVVLRYSIATQEWAVLSYATRPTVFSRYIDSTAVKVAYGDTTARVYEIDTGNTDNGTAVEYEVISHSLEFGALGLLKDINSNLMVYTKNSTDMEVQVNLDDTDFVTVGHALKNVEELPLTQEALVCNSAEIRIVGSSSGTQPVLKGFELTSVDTTGFATT